MERNGFANRFERLVGFAVQALAIAGLGLLTAIAIAIVVDVLLRFGFSIPIEGLSEVIALVSAVTIASFFPMSLKLGGHAKIRFLGHAFGPKAEKWLETFGDLLAVLFFAALTWQFARYTIELGQSGERTWILQLAPGPWWWVVTVLFGVSTLVQAGLLYLRVIRPAPVDAPVEQTLGV